MIEVTNHFTFQSFIERHGSHADRVKTSLTFAAKAAGRRSNNNKPTDRTDRDNLNRQVREASCEVCKSHSSKNMQQWGLLVCRHDLDVILRHFKLSHLKFADLLKNVVQSKGTVHKC